MVSRCAWMGDDVDDSKMRAGGECSKRGYRDTGRVGEYQSEYTLLPMGMNLRLRYGQSYR